MILGSKRSLACQSASGWRARARSESTSLMAGRFIGAPRSTMLEADGILVTKRFKVTADDPVRSLSLIAPSFVHR